MNEELRNAITALLVDIEAMAEGNAHGWFGAFSEGVMTMDGDYLIEWPNLAATVQEVRRLMEAIEP